MVVNPLPAVTQVAPTQLKTSIGTRSENVTYTVGSGTGALRLVVVASSNATVAAAAGVRVVQHPSTSNTFWVRSLSIYSVLEPRRVSAHSFRPWLPCAPGGG